MLGFEVSKEGRATTRTFRGGSHRRAFGSRATCRMRSILSATLDSRCFPHQRKQTARWRSPVGAEVGWHQKAQVAIIRDSSNAADADPSSCAMPPIFSVGQIAQVTLIGLAAGVRSRPARPTELPATAAIVAAKAGIDQPGPSSINQSGLATIVRSVSRSQAAGTATPSAGGTDRAATSISRIS